MLDKTNPVLCKELHAEPPGPAALTSAAGGNSASKAFRSASLWMKYTHTNINDHPVTGSGRGKRSFLLCHAPIDCYPTQSLEFIQRLLAIPPKKLAQPPGRQEAASIHPVGAMDHNHACLAVLRCLKTPLCHKAVYLTAPTTCTSG